MKKQLVLGSSWYNCPSDGAGPLREIFPNPIKIAKFSELELVDAIVIWGGSDISPSLYGETPIYNSGPDEPSARDKYELALIKYALANKIPLIGVCRGAQLLCAVAGGKLIQDVTGHSNGTHEVTTFDGFIFTCTSLHHQMMYPYDVDYELLAWSTKSLSSSYLPVTTEHSQKMNKSLEPECVYFPAINALCIQSHPEWEKKDCLYNRWFLKLVTEKCFGEIVNEI